MRRMVLLLAGLGCAEPEPEVEPEPPLTVVLPRFDWSEATGAAVEHTWEWSASDEDGEHSDYDLLDWTILPEGDGVRITIEDVTAERPPSATVDETVRTLRQDLRALGGDWLVDGDRVATPENNAWPEAQVLLEDPDAPEIENRQDYEAWLIEDWQRLMLSDLDGFSLSLDLPRELPERTIRGWEEGTARSITWTGRGACGSSSDATCATFLVFEEVVINGKPWVTITHRLSLDEDTLRPFVITSSRTDLAQSGDQLIVDRTVQRRDELHFDWR